MRSVRYLWDHFRTAVPVREEGYVGTSVSFVCILYGVVRYMEPRGIRDCIFPGVGRNVAKFKYLGKALTNQNRFDEEIKNRLNSGKAWYRSIQNRLSSCLLSRSREIKMYRTLILSLVLYGCETWYLICRKNID